MSASASTERATPRRTGAAIGRFLLTLLIFLLLGPLVGGLVAILGIATGLFGSSSPADVAAIALTMIIYGLWAAYPLGAIPAVVVGLVIAFRDLYGRAGWGFALLVGAAAGLIFLFAAGAGGEGLAVPVSYFAAAFVATLACFGATRGLQPRTA